MEAEHIHNLLLNREQSPETLTPPEVEALFAQADHHRIQSEYSERDAIYRKLIDHELKIPGTLTSEQISEVLITFADTDRRQGSIASALSQLAQVPNENLSETTYLRKIVAIAWCHFRQWNDSGRTDSDAYETCVNIFKQAHDFVMQCKENILPERAAQAVEGEIGVLVDGERFREAAELFETLQDLNSRLEDERLILRAQEQAMTCQAACLIHIERFEEAIAIAIEGASISTPGRHKLAHHFLLLDALVKGDLVESPKYIGERDAALKDITDYLTGPVTSIDHERALSEIIKESEIQRAYLGKWFPSLVL